MIINNYEGRTVLPLSHLLSVDSIPDSLLLLGDSIVDALEQITYTDAIFDVVEGGFQCSIVIIYPSNLEIELFGLDYVSFGIGEQGYVPFEVNATWTNDDLTVMLDNIGLAIRFSRDLVVPVEVDGDGVPVKENEEFKEISGDSRASIYTSGSVSLDKDFDITVEGFDSMNLTPCKLKDLPIAFIFEDLKLDLSKKSAIPEIEEVGFDTDFQGVFIGKLGIYFGGDLNFLPDLEAENFALGTGGISGKIVASFDLEYDAGAKKFNGDAAGSLFGAEIGLRKFEIEIRANEILSSEITGQMLLPFFEKPIEMELSFDLKGNISVGLKGTDGEVLAELTKEDILSMKINSFNFAKTEDEVAFTLGGSIKPLFGEDIAWPEFGVNALKVSHPLPGDPWDKWDITVDGGWIQFPETLSFTVSKFHGWVSKVGFGTVEGKKERFIGFSGGITFVSGFALAAEFEDLQLFYPDTTSLDVSKIRVELKRARIGLLIPDTIMLIGEVTKEENSFGGMIDLTIIPTEIRIMGGAQFGRTLPPDEFSYMQIMMALELPPPGIQLGSTPLAIRGFEGKHAMNMRPSMDPGWEWAITPPRGITPLSKMIPEKGSKLLGAGLKIVTTDGNMVIINALLALMLPGPIVLIEGRGAILKKTSNESSPADPPFYALIVIDGRERYFSANMSYKGDLARGIIKLTATLEVFFDFENPSNYHIKIGQKEPRNKRIQAVAFKVLKAQAYFELYKGPHILTGSYIGVDEKKNFKVGYAVLKAYIEGDVELSWKPEHAMGALGFGGEITIKVCGFGMGLGAGGNISAQTPYKRYLELAADYHFFFNLPWPLPDIEKSGEFKKIWQDGHKYPCRFEPLIAEVMVDSEMTGIPASKLLPNPSDETPISDIELVPYDARPTISFKYPINDMSSLPFAGNASDVNILHKIGDDKYLFTLGRLEPDSEQTVKWIQLERYKLPDDPGEYLEKLDTEISQIADSDDWEDIEIPYGVWIADNSMTGHTGAITLRLWAKTPFTHYRQNTYSPGLATAQFLPVNAQMADWINCELGGNYSFNVDDFVNGVGMDLTGTTTNLPAVIEEYAPGYPLEKQEAVWKYIGFSNVEIQYGVTEIDITSAMGLLAIPDKDGRTRPFDVIELPFLPPNSAEPFIHNVKTTVRGVYFEGSVKVQFSIPVAEVKIYIFPVSLMINATEEDLPNLEDFKDIYEIVSRYVSDESRDEDRVNGLIPLSYNYDFNIISRLSKYPPRIYVKRRYFIDDEERDSEVPYEEVRNTEEGLYTIKINKKGTPPDTIEITNTYEQSGLFMVAIGYLPDVDEAYNRKVDQIASFIEAAWPVEYVSSEEPESKGILKQRSCYRLTVKTGVACSATGNPQMEPHQFYFRTDGPPAAEHIKQYIAWAIPENNRYPVFRGYNVGLRFRSNHVDQFFLDAPLQLQLRSSSGGVIPFKTGDNLSWVDENIHLLSPEDEAYIDIINSSGVVAPIDTEAILPDRSLITNIIDNGILLERDKSYTAELRLMPESGFKIIHVKAEGFITYPQPIMATASENPGNIDNGAYPVVSPGGIHRRGKPVVPGDEEQSLFKFNFRSSRFENFADMFSDILTGKDNIRDIITTDSPGFSAVINNLVGICHETWVPLKMEIWETKLLIQQRLEKEDRLLEAQERLADADAQLDAAFGDVLNNINGLGGLLLQPLPKRVTVYFSTKCIMIEFPERIEFARIRVNYPSFDVSVVCNSDETRLLIFPVSASDSDTFNSSSSLTLSYHLDIGDNYPRLRYGSSIIENVQIPLASVSPPD